MGAFKQMLLEEMDRLDRLCVYCEDRPRSERCPICADLTICNVCYRSGVSPTCDYCQHVFEKDD
jgi:hypothetical protein